MKRGFSLFSFFFFPYLKIGSSCWKKKKKLFKKIYLEMLKRFEKSWVESLYHRWDVNISF